MSLRSLVRLDTFGAVGHRNQYGERPDSLWLCGQVPVTVACEHVLPDTASGEATVTSLLIYLHSHWSVFAHEHDRDNEFDEGISSYLRYVKTLLSPWPSPWSHVRKKWAARFVQKTW